MNAARGKPGRGWRNTGAVKTYLDTPVPKPPPLPPHLPVEDLTWISSALCAQVDLDLDFPPEGGSNIAAKSVCARCPVRAACLDYALRHHETYGVWGGLSAYERRQLYTEDLRLGMRHPIRHGTESGCRAHYRHGEPPCDACKEASAKARNLRGRRRRAA